MITILIIITAFSVVVTAVVIYFATRVVEDRSARLVFFIVGALSPIMLVVSGIRTLILRCRPQMVPCPELLATIEQEIEQERIETFGGSRLIPPLAHSWQAAYLQSLQRTASNVGSVFSAVGIHKKDHPAMPAHV